ncbi:hypothetical protein ES703_91305 [subsurface metagenome]
MLGRIEKIQGVLHKIEDGLLIAGGGFCVVMVLLVAVGVLGRYLLKLDLIPGTYQYVEFYLLPLVVFLAFAATLRANIFPRLDFIVARLPSRAEHQVELAVLAIELVAFGTAAWCCWQMTAFGTLRGLVKLAGTMQMPIGPAIGLAALGWTILTIEVIFQIISRALYRR